jgi:hypothetical protein
MQTPAPYTPAKGDYFVAKYRAGLASIEGNCLRADSIAGEFIFYSYLTRPKTPEQEQTWTPSDEAIFTPQWDFTKVESIP